MFNEMRKIAGITVVWFAMLGILTVWPDTPAADVKTSGRSVASSADPAGTLHQARYVYTGLWVADGRNDGTVVYLREIKRR